VEHTASNSGFGRPRHSCAITAGVVLVLVACTSLPARAAFVPIFGSPIYVPGGGGDMSYFPDPTVINDSGVAAGYADRLNAADLFESLRAVRWDATGAAIELPALGSGHDTSSTIGIPPAINDSGVIVGSVGKYDASGTSMGSRPVRWDAAGNPLELQGLGANASGITSGRARAVNASGIAAGTVDKYDAAGTSLGSRAVRWDAAGNVQELNSLSTKSTGFASSEAFAMNANNVVVGYGIRYDASNAVKGTRAVRWDAAGNVQELTENFGTSVSGVSQSEAVAINDSGIAVGYADKFDAFGNAKGERAVRWDAAGTALELGNLGTSTTGSSGSHASAINAAGVAVGYSSKFDAAGNSKGQRAVRWDATGAVQELGTLGTTTDGNTVSEAYALNAAGIAVGYAHHYAADGTQLGDNAVYWDQAGTAINLNSLIDPASGWILSYANSISDTGWIAGIGQFDPDGAGPAVAYTRLFSMQVPAAAVPEPSALLGVGAIACLARRWRRP
jgi:hypothetical protein